MFILIKQRKLKQNYVCFNKTKEALTFTNYKVK